MRLMSYPHFNQNLRKKNGSVEKNMTGWNMIVKDIENFQWSAITEELFQQLKEKYSDSGSEIEDFLRFLKLSG